MRSDRAVSTALLALAGSFFIVILIRTAWVSDAAYLTLRTVEHAASGFGARWNVAERVQVFDHPLWFLLLLAGRWIAGGTYVVALALSIACSAAAVWVILRDAATDAVVLFVAAALTLSPLFVTFSTSGLETPLLHLLTVLIARRACDTERPDSHRRVAMMTGLAILTRWSIAWIAVPAWIAVARKSGRRALAIDVIFIIAPLLLWSLWAWRYYGVLTPTSWIADASQSLTWRDRLSLGGSFFDQTLGLDPLLVVTIASGLVVGMWAGSSDRWLAAGAIVEIAWTIGRGGSEMAGRDLTAPFLVAVILIVRRVNQLRPAWGAGAAVAAVLAGIVAYAPTYRSDSRFGVGWRGTTRSHDPRLDDYQATALLLTNRLAPAPRGPEAERGAAAASGRRAAEISSHPGIFGIAAGPSVFVVDPHGAGDSLIARLPPAVGVRREWTMARRIPEGYLGSVTAARSTLSDPALAALDDELRLLTRAPLETPGRQKLWQTLSADARRLLAQSSYGPDHTTLAEMAQETPHQLREGGLLIALPQRQTVARLDAMLSGNYDYEVHWLDGDTTVAVSTLDSSLTSPPALALRAVVSSSSSSSITTLWLRCGRGVGPCLVGTVRLGH